MYSIQSVKPKLAARFAERFGGNAQGVTSEVSHLVKPHIALPLVSPLNYVSH